MAHPRATDRTSQTVWRDDGGVPGIGLEPSFAIGHAPLLLREPDGCVMWDCIPLATDQAIEYVRSLGGLKAIAVSHPHYYGAVADWSEAFGGIPIYLHGDDRAWITRPHPAIVPWYGESCRLSNDILILRAGGHFSGGTLLHWRAAAEAQGACPPATSLRSRWTAVRSASCTATRTTSRLTRKPFAASPKSSSPWR